MLENGQTLSIRTSKQNDKIAPRVIGQAGYKRLNSFFKDIYGKPIKNQNDIKSLFYYNIAELIPTLFDYLLTSDFTVWIFQKNISEEFEYIILPGDMTLDINYDTKNFSFTRRLENWNESITLKYNRLSIAEIQTHKKRTFKFRFIMKNLIELLQEANHTNETLGVTAEKAICDLFNLKYPENFKYRSSPVIQKALSNSIIEAFNYIPKPIKHTGSFKGSRSSHSKCPYDFILEGNKKLSVKTYYGRYVCPPEVGQPSAETCYLYFVHLINEKHIDENIFKNMVLNKVHKLIPIYLKHLFDSDYLLWIYKKGTYDFKIYEKNFGVDFDWDKQKFTFSNETVEDWNECNSVRYDGISLGQFQVHKNRNSYKFRFNIPNLIEIIKNR